MSYTRRQFNQSTLSVNGDLIMTYDSDGSYGDSSIDDADNLIKGAKSKLLSGARDADAINDLRAAISILDNCTGDRAINLRRSAQQELDQLGG